MKKYLIKVNDNHYEVEVSEVKSSSAKPAPAAPAPAPANRVASTPTNSKDSKSSGGSRKVNAPMPGSILKIIVKVGDAVTKGQPLLVFEAMKMENDLTSPADGVIAEINTSVGKTMAAGETLIVLN